MIANKLRSSCFLRFEHSVCRGSLMIIDYNYVIDSILN